MISSEMSMYDINRIKYFCVCLKYEDRKLIKISIYFYCVYWFLVYIIEIKRRIWVFIYWIYCFVFGYYVDCEYLMIKMFFYYFLMYGVCVFRMYV